MQARVCEILARAKDLVVEPAHPRHFVLSEGVLTDALFLQTDRNWTLHGIFPDTREALFLELPEGTDLGVATFAYVTQFDLATRAALVSFDDFLALAEGVAGSPNPVFVFNIGRCGSTLLSKIFAEVPGVWSLSEPDPLSNISLDRVHYTEDEKVALVRASVRFLFRPPAGREGDTFVVKFRSFTTYDMAPYFAAFPEAHHLFLWRDARGWTNSFYMLGQLLGGDWDMTSRESLDFRWNVMTAGSPIELYAAFDDVRAERGAEETLLAAVWATSMSQYLAARQANAPLELFSYRQLNKEREVTIARLLAACGLPESHLPRALRAFERHSQEDSILAGAEKMVPLSEAQQAKIARLLEGHPAMALSEERPVSA